MARERDWVKGQNSAGGCGAGTSKDNDGIEEDGDIMLSEDDHASMVAYLPDGEEGVGLEIGEDMDTSHDYRETTDGEKTCVTDVDAGAIWQGDVDHGCGRSDVLQIVLHFEEVVGGTRVYNGWRGGGVCGIKCITIPSSISYSYMWHHPFGSCMVVTGLTGGSADAHRVVLGGLHAVSWVTVVTSSAVVLNIEHEDVGPTVATRRVAMSDRGGDG
jgi:hypothetical protein